MQRPQANYSILTVQNKQMYVHYRYSSNLILISWHKKKKNDQVYLIYKLCLPVQNKLPWYKSSLILHLSFYLYVHVFEGMLESYLYLFSHRRCRAQAWLSSLSLKPWLISQPHLFGLWCSSLCWSIWDWAACSALSRASLPPLWTPSKYGRNTSQVSQCQKKKYDSAIWEGNIFT